MIKTRIKRSFALFLVLVILFSFPACSSGKSPETETPVSGFSAKGVAADWADFNKTDLKSGTVYFGAIKTNYADYTSEPLYCYKFDGVFSAVENSAEEFNGESIILEFQINVYTDPTLTPHPVDSEEHFNYLKSVIGALDGNGADSGSATAFTLYLKENGKEKAVYSFRCDMTVEMKRGNETKYSSVDEETFAHIAMLCTIYAPFNLAGNALLLRGSNNYELLSAENYKLTAAYRDKSKEYGADAALKLAQEHFGGKTQAVTFAPVINTEFDFETGDYIKFRETYKLGGTEYEKLFFLGSDGRIYNTAKNGFSSQKIYLQDGYYFEFKGNAVRVNRSSAIFDYHALKAMIEG